MRFWGRTLVVVTVALLALCALALGAVLVWFVPQHVGSVMVDGQEIVLGPAHAGHWLLASAAVLAVIAVLLVVVPLVLAVAVLIPLLVGLVLPALLVGGLLAVPLLPLIALGAWLWRRSRRRSAGATMAA